MYTTGGLFLPEGLGPDVTPRHKTIRGEESFLYEYARYLLHKRLTTEKLLSPYANYFYSPTYMTSATTEGNNVPTKINIDRDEIAKQLQKHPENVILREDIINTTETIPKEERWTEVKNKAAVPLKPTPEIQIKEGYYDILNEEKEDEYVHNEELKDDDGEVDEKDGNDKPQKEVQEYNVEKMTLEDIEKVLKSEVLINNKPEEEIEDRSTIFVDNDVIFNEGDEKEEEMEEDDISINVAMFEDDEYCDLHQNKMDENEQMKQLSEDLQHNENQIQSQQEHIDMVKIKEKTMDEKLLTKNEQPNEIAKEVDQLKMKTVDNFYEEVAEIKLKNMELIDKIEWYEKEMDKVAHRESKLESELGMKEEMIKTKEIENDQLKDEIKQNEQTYKKFIRKKEEEWLMKEEEYKEEAEWHIDEMTRLIMRLKEYGEVFDVDDED